VAGIHFKEKDREMASTVNTEWSSLRRLWVRGAEKLQFCSMEFNAGQRMT
jgi:hypothetical protein